MMNGSLIWKLQKDEDARIKKEMSATLPTIHSGKHSFTINLICVCAYI